MSTTDPTPSTPLSAADLLELASTDVSTPLPVAALRAALSSPPFVALPDTPNARDLGLVPGSPIRPGLAFRSGGFLQGLSPAGSAALAALGVRRIFDLRSVGEHARAPDPVVDGVEGVWVRPGEQDAVVSLDEFVEGHGERGFVNMYLNVLKVYAGGIRRLLEAVRDGRGEEPFLFHCTAGRDRTGVVAGLLLTLAGASRETVALDFILSRIGTEPAREQLLAFALHGSRAASVETPGFHNMLSLRISCWEAFVKAVETEYGGFEGYVTKTLGFSEEDLAKIRDNLVLKN
ncbi:12fb2916-9243-4fd9-b33b-56a64b7f9621 [Thermothielavioides terrestris]|uniref:12fb2916-9243-4fd9-b33b-56a64b7f9621 n=1 Tax=Thermothielavioides terrestris TaxID=2587410 RepID=A0A3S4ANJ7_9PEZI|nr:12fb2916-9243-4fd9-b33b-56a64b7f9621 [Thermothielavioides terrestris]